MQHIKHVAVESPDTDNHTKIWFLCIKKLLLRDSKTWIDSQHILNKSRDNVGQNMQIWPDVASLCRCLSHFLPTITPHYLMIDSICGT